MNAPTRMEAWQVWEPCQRLSGHSVFLRARRGGVVIVGSIGAPLQLGQALGVPPRVVAKCWRPIEAVMVRKLKRAR